MSAVVYVEAARFGEVGDDACDDEAAVEWHEQADGSLVHWLGGVLGNAHAVHVVVRTELGGRRARPDDRKHEAAGAVYKATWVVLSDVGVLAWTTTGSERWHARGEVVPVLGEDRSPLTDAVAEAMHVGLEHARLVARRLEAGIIWEQPHVHSHVPEPSSSEEPEHQARAEPSPRGQLGLALG